MADPHGWLFVDKPPHLSSNAVLQKVRRHFGRTKAGHVGTLDPLATGLLPIALGEACKTIPFLEGQPKTYTFDIVWGESRTTGDAEGYVTELHSHRPTVDDIQACLPHFVGELLQTPPLYSAIKIKGEPAYKRVRRGEALEMPPRKTHVYDLSILGMSSQDRCTFQVCTKSGFYVRSLARDMAQFLGTVGYADQIRRIKIGSFGAHYMVSLEKILETTGNFEVKGLYPLDVVLDDIPVVMLDNAQTKRAQYGQQIHILMPESPSSGRFVLCKSPQGLPVGLFYQDSLTLFPKRLFNLSTKGDNDVDNC